MAEQFLRRASLLVTDGTRVLDLSSLRFTFQVRAADTESPNNAVIRVFNVSAQTRALIQGEFARVVLQAGYEENFGVIFDGTIKQIGIGRQEGSTDTYLDLKAADGDIPYTEAFVATSLPAGTTSRERAEVAVAAMQEKGVLGAQNLLPETGGILPRGKVLWGLARAQLRHETEAAGATWSIQQGYLQIIPKTGYLPSEAVVLNGQTGLIGRAEQTVDGIRAKCLINPNIKVGTLVRIDNAAINQTLQQDPNAAPVPFDQWAGLQLLANINADGLYRAYVIEYDGDTRGNAWYATLTLLAINPATDEVVIE